MLPSINLLNLSIYPSLSVRASAKVNYTHDHMHTWQTHYLRAAFLGYFSLFSLGGSFVDSFGLILFWHVSCGSCSQGQPGRAPVAIAECEDDKRVPPCLSWPSFLVKKLY